MREKARVLLVDDHPVVRHGLARLISQEPDLAACGEAANVPEAIQAATELRPDVVVVDLSLKEGSGIDLIKTLHAQAPAIAILVLTMHEESFYAERALRAGARGYLTKQEASEKILTAIRQVAKGEIYVSEKLSPKLLKRLIAGAPDDEPLVSRLSDRELQVFLLIGEGRGTQEIADRLHLSVKTIETYRAHLKDKLSLRDARELVQYAIRWVVSHDPR